jgi:hypothetical protein
VDIIKANHNNRMAKLKEMIEDRRTMLEDHTAGRRLLNEEDHARTTKQYSNFQRKLEQMENHNTDVSNLVCVCVWIVNCVFESLRI